MTPLPISGATVLLRLPDGADEIALNEGDASPIPGALGLLRRIAAAADDRETDWAKLPVTDFEILLLRLREMVVGGTVSSDVGCPTCRERVEISFSINDYIQAVKPRTPRGVVPSSEAGWFADEGAEFRLPLVADLLAIRNAPAPGAALRARCLSPRGAPRGEAPRVAPRLRARIEGAIALMAPEVSGPVGGACPACGAAVEALFDVAPFVMTELRRIAAGAYADVHLLASAYGWDEATILALPGTRRRRYAELVRDAADPGSIRDANYLAVA